MIKQILLSFLIIPSVMIGSITGNLYVRTNADHINLFNPDKTLKVVIEPRELNVNWKQLESDYSSRLRLSYAPNRNIPDEVVVAFDLLKDEISPDLSLIEFSKEINDYIMGNYSRMDGITVLAIDDSAEEITINGKPAMKWDNMLLDVNDGQIAHLSIILTEGKEHYVHINILCDVKDYSDDRDMPYWKVIETMEEL